MRPARAILLALAALLLVACGGSSSSVPVAEWALEANGASMAITLPAHFDQRVGDRVSDYVLTTRVVLPTDLRGRPLALTIPYFTGLASLTANGLAAPDFDAAEVERTRSLGPHRFLIPVDATKGESVDLALTVHHTWTMSAWLDTVPRLTADTDGGASYVFVKLFDRWSAAAAFAMLLLVGFANGIVFLADRRRKAYGWFTVSSVAGSTYAAYTLGLTQPPFGGYEGAFVGILVCISSVGAACFTAHVFDRKPSPLWWAIVVVWCAGATRFAGPFESARYLSPITVASNVVVGLYAVALLLLELRRGRPPASKVLATIGWPIVSLLAVDDFASWLGCGELYSGLRGASLGMALVALMQAAALGVQLLQTLRRADALNAALAVRVGALEKTNVEVAGLNDELRRQIGNRSTQLAETLAKVGSLHLPALAMEPGDVVQGTYRVVRFVGSGGMAWVYEVKRETDGRRLAMKLLHGRSNGAALARFAREAKLASEVPHPGIVGVVDVDLTPEGVLFLVMEYVDGRSVEQVLDEDPPLPWAITVLRQIAGALEAVHARGIVHRDLKPANVLVEETLDGPVAKIADFGLSMLLSHGERAERPGPDASGDVRVTRAGRVMGTPEYMAPELAREGTPIRGSIDLYALGVMAHELVVGRPPFRDPLFVRAVHGRSLPPPTSLAVIRPRLDRRICDLVDRCLSLDPGRRPTAAEAARVLRDARLEAEPTSVPSIRVG